MINWETPRADSAVAVDALKKQFSAQAAQIADL
jgi:hypothetical protein